MTNSIVLDIVTRHWLRHVEMYLHNNLTTHLELGHLCLAFGR